MQDKEDPGHAA